MTPLRIGFLVHGTTAPAWYAHTIKTVADAGHVLTFFVQPMQERNAKKPLVLSLFQSFEDRWFRLPEDALKPVSLDLWMTAANTVHLQQGDGFPSGIPSHLLYAHQKPNAALVAFAAQTAFGLWWVEFANGEAGLPAFWEVMRNEAVTHSRLLVYWNERTLLAYDGSTRTVPYSVKNNLRSVAWKAAGYLPLRLAAVQRLQQRYLLQLPAVAETVLPESPGNLRTAALALRNGTRYVRQKLQEKKQQQFTLLYSSTPFDLESFGQAQFTPLPLPPGGTFYADPFAIEKDGKTAVFFEEMDAAKGRAHISVILFDENGKPGSPQAVLKRPYHLSYPFVFAHDGQHYMVPETAANRTVELYRATAFPHGWEHVMNLMDGVELLDATLLFEAGKWWLFAGGSTHPFASTNDQLFLYWSDSLFSTHWTPHPLNPVATGAGNCRPAGRIFRQGDKWYRPAQNNASQQYGYGLKLNEIVELSETAYSEKEVLSIEPEALGLTAIHHLDFTASMVVIDGILG